MSDERNSIINYICELYAPEDDLCRKILAKQASLGPMMNIGPDQAKFITLLISMLKPQRFLELGSYCGYSSLWIARALQALGPNHHLHCIESSAKHIEVLQEHLAEAAVLDLCTIYQGLGIDVMTELIKQEIKFDMIFIDADKNNYPQYLELAWELLPRGGILLADNTLWGGEVINSNSTDTRVQALRLFNEELAKKWNSCLLTIQDGLSIGIR